VNHSAAVAEAQIHIMESRNLFFEAVASAITPRAGPKTITMACDAAKITLQSVFAAGEPAAITPVKNGPKITVITTVTNAELAKS
jgi:hypothetical protein